MMPYRLSDDARLLARVAQLFMRVDFCVEASADLCLVGTKHHRHWSCYDRGDGHQRIVRSRRRSLADRRLPSVRSDRCCWRAIAPGSISETAADLTGDEILSCQELEANNRPALATHSSRRGLALVAQCALAIAILVGATRYRK
jgi:hypothetical protein